MATQWLRRAWLHAACASALLLAACGGSSIVQGFTPTRVVAFGDASADLGQNGRRFTVNDGSVNNWTQFVAEAYGQRLTPSSAGGLSFAVGNARVTAKPDAAGNASTPTVKEQIDTFLASGTLNESDLVIVSAGYSDVIVQAQAVMDGRISAAEAQVNVEQAAQDLSDQVRRLVNAGAKHVLVSGPYDMSKSAWAAQTGQGTLLQHLSALSGNTGADQPRSFNERLLISMVDLGDNVLYVDSALEFNLETGNPTSSAFALTDVTNPVCTSVDPGPGIGTGPGQVNSNLCTTDTVGGRDPQAFLFADRVYPTPHGHRIFGDFAFNRSHDRW